MYRHRKRQQSEIKILQTNLHRERAAHDMAQLTSHTRDIDLIMASEPNKTLVRNSKWIVDINLDVAVNFRNTNIEVEKIEREEGILVVHLKRYHLYCCYSSPNISLTEFKSYIDKLMDMVGQDSKEAIILGDLNIKSPQWGAPRTDARGEYFTEWISSMNIITLNSGNTPTFIRGNSVSYIDVTCSTSKIARYIKNWKVLEDEAISDHNFIYFEVEGDTYKNKRNTERQKTFFDKEKFNKKMEEKAKMLLEKEEISVEGYIKELGHAYKESTGRNGTPNMQVPFWWNPEIEHCRNDCKIARRTLTRQRKRGDQLNERTIAQLMEEYKNKKKELKKCIIVSKNQHWKNLCRELDNNLWGNGFKIAMKHLKKPFLPYTLPKEKILEIVDTLFPDNDDSWNRGSLIRGVEPFTYGELETAIKNMKNGKAPGPDRIPPEAIKELVEHEPNLVLRILNDLLRKQEFPKLWKLARVILLLKNGKSIEQASAFRPICLLDTMGKLYEMLLRERLEQELAGRNGLSNKQFGFRRGRSTIQAVEAVQKAVSTTKEKWCVLITLDIKNAFNSATWSYIIRELKNKQISQYLINIMESYFTERKLKVSGVLKDMKMGVPQGSVLGPILWNIFYDGILELDLGQNVTTIGFADDLAILIKNKQEKYLVLNANEALRKIDHWLTRNDLDLAPEKTEAVILKGGRKAESVRFNIRGTEVIPQKSVKYLGILMGRNGSFADHINMTINKAEQRISSLSQLLPNIGGPKSQKRAVLCGVIHSILLYGAPIWQKMLNMNLYKNKMEKTQRKALLRVASAYRTASSKALQVITGTPPIEVLVKEREYMYISVEPIEEKRRVAKQKTVDLWQQMWNNNLTKGQWTKRLIPDLHNWINCKHRNIDYYMTQVLSGHGSFQAYLKKIGVIDDDKCLYCDAIDTVEHTFFECIRWENYRSQTYLTLGHDLNLDNLIPSMIESERKWKIIQTLMHQIMKNKENDRNRRQRGN